MHPDFQHITTWVFDLDHTLYPPSARLFDLMEPRLSDWIMAALQVDRPQADHLRQHYWQTYGTTLAGLMTEHNVDPAPYLTHVHDIPLDTLSPDPALAHAIAALPGRRIVFTNGPHAYAQNVLHARGLTAAFDAVYGVEQAGFHPKPSRHAFDMVFKTDGLIPTQSAMFEDDPRNLTIPRALGMQTILVGPDAHPDVHHHTTDLTQFLQTITAA
jgi:putative hydrolase of the HAD superfamily